jgi:hypothetical protein
VPISPASSLSNLGIQNPRASFCASNVKVETQCISEIVAEICPNHTTYQQKFNCNIGEPKCNLSCSRENFIALATESVSNEVTRVSTDEALAISQAAHQEIIKKTVPV